jgi:hypothetical protein
MRLNAELMPIADLSAETRARMFALMDAHYACVRSEQFNRDLNEKQWAILVQNAKGEVRGFSTLAFFDADVDGRQVRILFSGDTIVEREYWGDPALAAAWGRFALSAAEERPGEELYWLLVSKGFRTYRYLPLFFREFYPRYDRPIPDGLRCVLDAAAKVKYAATYDAARGLIRGDWAKDRLRPELAGVSAGRLSDPHVRYFVERNPTFAQGDELCCLAPIARDNFTDAAHRVIASRRLAPLGK